MLRDVNPRYVWILTGNLPADVTQGPGVQNVHPEPISVLFSTSFWTTGIADERLASRARPRGNIIFPKKRNKKGKFKRARSEFRIEFNRTKRRKREGNKYFVKRGEVRLVHT